MKRDQIDRLLESLEELKTIMARSALANEHRHKTQEELVKVWAEYSKTQQKQLKVIEELLKLHKDWREVPLFNDKPNV